MNILTLNCGSSSVKYSLWKMPARKKLCSGIVDRVTVGGSSIKHKGKKSIVLKKECPTYDAAIKLILELLTDTEYGALKDTSEVDAVGHRVVHGGERFNRSVKINEEVIKVIEECCVLAPLHNPPNLLGIRAAMNLMPDIPHIAIFDTAFLSTIPKHVYTYALPYEWYQKYGIRRYGFHGTSHLYVSRRAAALLHKNPSDVNIITLHIGNGVSITAVKKGVAFDHSMGFTPLEGAVMGTRCGDIDPTIPLYVMQKEGLTVRDMEDILNKKSGLLGITGRYSDRRDIIKAAKKRDGCCQLAIEIECYRLKKYIGAYAAAMGKADAVVFTAGAGENSSIHRGKVCENLECLGIKIDLKKNESAVGRRMEIDISVDDPKYPVKVFVIPTDEELVFAEDVYAILQGTYDIYTNFGYIFQREDFTPTL
jgi:acetate kinase